MESQPQNPEFMIDLENFYPCKSKLTLNRPLYFVLKMLFSGHEHLTLCMLGNFSRFFCRLQLFFNVLYSVYHQSVIQLGSRPGLT